METINIREESEKILESKKEWNYKIDLRNKILDIFINELDGIKTNQFKKIEKSIENNIKEDKVYIYYERGGFDNDIYTIRVNLNNLKYQERYISIWLGNITHISKDYFESKKVFNYTDIPTLKQIERNLERTKKETEKIYNQFSKFCENKNISGIDRQDYFNKFISELDFKCKLKVS